MLAAALAASWPLARDPGHLAPVRPTDNDFRFNLYVIFWGAHALVTDPLSLHHTNMFHPEPYTFAYSDIELAHSLLALPVIAASGNPVLTYNLLLLASMIIGGVGFFLLARTLVGHSGAALLGAALFVFNPAHFTRYQQIQFFGDHWLPWMAWALVMGLSSPNRQDDHARWRWPALAALFFCLHALTGSHNAVFGALVAAGLVVGYAILEARWADRRLWVHLAIVVLLCLLVLGPLFWPYLIMESQMLDSRFEGVDTAGLGTARAYELLSARSRLYRWLDETTGLPSRWFDRELESYLFPGLVLLGLGAVGAAGAARDRRRAPWLALLALFVATAIGPWGGLWLLLEHLPGVRLIRVPSRYMMPALFALAVLATFAAARLVRRRRHGSWLLALLALLFALESVHAPLRTWHFDPTPDPLVRWLGQQRGDFAVVELPLAAESHTISMRQVFYSIHHWKKLLVGYSGHEPPGYEARLDELAASFPGDDCLDRLLELDVRYVIVIEPRMRPEDLDAVRQQSRLQPLRRFDGDVVYELLP